ncbi:hypothetical protein GWK48_10535 [Metallosphaera tengchongensis]|uniref:PIN domain-containing protein n=1 Tax=Metallosphaera tengchongensis TaxID=1532350 RepID=A0A6N0NZI6_9CREN|nr:hypothetical protein [Metallosphaera tengchongensis]QKR00768.1 hypothetical protein GWK48_10535 [Metallosphaera tengchongensis]
MASETSKVCAVIPINRSDMNVESAHSAIVRTYELFNPRKFVILKAKFNEKLLLQGEPLRDLLDGLKRANVDVKEKDLTGVTSFQGFKSTVEGETQDCGKVYLVPTPGANITAVYLTLLYNQDTMKYVLVNYVFGFGAWYHLYYPFVPRPLEGLETVPDLGDKIKPNWNLLSNLRRTFEDQLSSVSSSFIGSVSYYVMELNRRGDGRGYELRVDQDKVLDTTNFELGSLRRNLGDRFVNSMDACVNGNRGNNRQSDWLDQLLSLSGAYELEVEKETENNRVKEPLSNYSDEKVVIDTNAIYYGIHTYELKHLIVPYCVYNELMLASSKGGPTSVQRSFSAGLDGVLGELALDLAFYLSPSLVPTQSLQCDVAIPRIDPDLIRDSVVITADNKALMLWKRKTMSKYTTIMRLIKTNNPKRSPGDRMMSIASLAVSLSRVLDYCNYKYDIELCWEGIDTCVKVEPRP